MLFSICVDALSCVVVHAVPGLGSLQQDLRLLHVCVVHVSSLCARSLIVCCCSFIGSCCVVHAVVCCCIFKAFKLQEDPHQGLHQGPQAAAVHLDRVCSLYAVCVYIYIYIFADASCICDD